MTGWMDRLVDVGGMKNGWMSGGKGEWMTCRTRALRCERKEEIILNKRRNGERCGVATRKAEAKKGMESPEVEKRGGSWPDK